MRASVQNKGLARGKRTTSTRTVYVRAAAGSDLGVDLGFDFKSMLSTPAAPKAAAPVVAEAKPAANPFQGLSDAVSAAGEKLEKAAASVPAPAAADAPYVPSKPALDPELLGLYDKAASKSKALGTKLTAPEPSFRFGLGKPATAPAPVEAAPAPRIEVPRLEAPKVERTELNDVKMPEFKAPDMPKFDMPKFEAPDMPKFETPDMPKFDMPKFEAPDMPDFKAPDMPKFDMPKFEAPKMKMPEVNRPAAKLPEVKAPSVPAPKPVVEAAPAPAPAPGPVVKAEVVAPPKPVEIAPPAPAPKPVEVAPPAPVKAVEVPAPAPAAPAPAPAAEVPSIENPSKPSLDELQGLYEKATQKTKVPAPKLELPEFSAPELPKFSAPKVELPKLEVPSALTKAVEGAGKDLSSGANEVAGTITGAADSVGKEAARILNTGSSTLTNIQRELNSEVTGAVSGVVKAVSGAVSAAESAVGGAVATAAASVEKAGAAAYTSLPPEAQQALDQLAPVAKSAAAAAEANPEAAAAVASAAVALPILSWWNAEYGGYAGKVSADRMLELLQKDDYLMVDIREEDERERSGLPVLKRSARNKAVALPLESVPRAAAASVRNASTLAEQWTAAKIAGLRTVGPSTRVIVLDKSESRAIAVARALRSQGIAQPFVLEGGFKSVSKSGTFQIKTGSTQYETGTFKLVEDELEVLGTELQEGLFSRPERLALVGLGLGLGGYAIYDWHHSLQFFGALGVQLTIAKKLSSYSSPQEFFADVGAFYENLERLAKGRKATAGDESEPSI